MSHFSKKRATYHYINVPPQWQTFNGENWLEIEDGLREFITDSYKDHVVITGGTGVCELDDINGNKVGIYLNMGKAINIM